VFGNPTSRQRVDRSSPLYDHEHYQCSGIPQRGSVWMVQVLSTITSITSVPGIPQRGSVWIVQVLSTITSITSVPGIPHRGSVWIVQVLSTITSITSVPGIPQRGSVWIVQVLSTNEPLTINGKSHSAAACGWFKSSLCRIKITSRPAPNKERRSLVDRT